MCLSGQVAPTMVSHTHTVTNYWVAEGGPKERVMYWRAFQSRAALEREERSDMDTPPISHWESETPGKHFPRRRVPPRAQQLVRYRHDIVPPNAV